MEDIALFKSVAMGYNNVQVSSMWYDVREILAHPQYSSKGALLVAFRS